ncbi:hypothetical protein ACFL08_00930 [Patescibacteria group bacterium]
MRGFDTWALNGFQKFSHWTDDLVGVNNFFWAKLINVIMFYLICLQFYIDVGHVEGTPATVALSSLAGLHLILCILLFLGSLKAEGSFEENYKHVANELATFYQSRYGAIAMFAADAVVIAKGGIFIVIAKGLLVAVCYFIACTPRPPSESRVKRWIKRTIGRYFPYPV